jgi:hypothetical protein
MIETWYELKLGHQLLQRKHIGPLLSTRQHIWFNGMVYDVVRVLFSPEHNKQIVELTFDVANHCEINNIKWTELVDSHLHSGWKSQRKSAL